MLKTALCERETGGWEWLENRCSHSMECFQVNEINNQGRFQGEVTVATEFWLGFSQARLRFTKKWTAVAVLFLLVVVVGLFLLFCFVTGRLHELSTKAIKME